MRRRVGFGACCAVRVRFVMGCDAEGSESLGIAVWGCACLPINSRSAALPRCTVYLG